MSAPADGVDLIAREYGWSQSECFALEAPAFFYHAMLARRSRWQRFADARLASTFPHLDEAGREAVAKEQAAELEGPGVYVDWRDTMSAKAKAELEASERELDETWETFQAVFGG